ncbi:hypothetical protein ACTHAM_000094 [Cellulomonas soli]|uniref:hypothetical protein n=1 Tax=Cellulomonas soli TaxID=931535 RepID=UPI003F84DC0E
MTSVGPDGPREHDQDPDDPLVGFEVPDDLSSLFEDVDVDAAPLGGSVPSSDAGTDGRSGAGRGTGATQDESIVVPDDLGALAAQEVPTVALVVTQVAAPGPLAAICSLVKVEVDAVASPIGAIAVLRDPAEAATATRAVSQRLRGLPVVLLERRAERVTATQWSDGELVEELPSGLVLSDAPQVLEDLLLHDAPVASIDGVVTSVGLSRWRAMRWLTTPPKRPKG